LTDHSHPIVEPLDATLGSGPFSSIAAAVEGFGHEQEWIFEGHASRFHLVGDYLPSGRWHAEPAESAPFRTRLHVVWPHPARFNGTVVAVWNNVSSGNDGVYAGVATEILVRDGFAVVGVTAQRSGIEAALVGLAAQDPVRYCNLHHPGDDYSFDIFSQAVTFLSASRADHPLAGLDVQRVVAAGVSQSACRLATLHNALHGSMSIDAYMLIVYAGNGTYIDTTTTVPAGFAEVPDNSLVAILPFRSHRLRDDLGAPVVIVNSETETSLFTYNDQPDSDWMRVWENAGTSHVGTNLSQVPPLPGNAPCRGSFGPAVRGAYHALQGWLATGVSPPSQPRIVKGPDRVIARDHLGNALGGIRWPHVEVPLATHRGESPRGQIDLLGSSIPFSSDEVRRLYAGRSDYHTRCAAAVEALVATGVILPDDAEAVLVAARNEWL
jgi:Alpha/beta hydrolase domain